MENRNTIAVIIPTWRRPVQLRKLLISLELQIRQPDEIIIACRYNDYESLKVVDGWTRSSPLAARHKLRTVRDEGHLPPLISALQDCESDIFCQVDDDAIPKENWLLELGRDFQDPFIGGIGGKVINHYRKPGDSRFNGIETQAPGKLSWFGRSGSCKVSKDYRGKLFESDCFIGCNMAFRKTALIDSLDMTLNGGSAISYETDIALNVKSKGFKVFYDPKVVVDHHPAPRHINADRGWNSKECFWYAHNLTYICFKHLSWYGKVGFIFYFFIGGTWGCPGLLTYILSLVLGRFISWRKQFIPSLEGRLAGLKTYYRMRLNPLS